MKGCKHCGSPKEQPESHCPDCGELRSIMEESRAIHECGVIFLKNTVVSYYREGKGWDEITLYDLAKIVFDHFMEKEVAPIEQQASGKLYEAAKYPKQLLKDLSSGEISIDEWGTLKKRLYEIEQKEIGDFLQKSEREQK